MDFRATACSAREKKNQSNTAAAVTDRGRSDVSEKGRESPEAVGIYSSSSSRWLVTGCLSSIMPSSTPVPKTAWWSVAELNSRQHSLGTDYEKWRESVAAKRPQGILGSDCIVDTRDGWMDGWFVSSIFSEKSHSCYSKICINCLSVGFQHDLNKTVFKPVKRSTSNL